MAREGGAKAEASAEGREGGLRGIRVLHQIPAGVHMATGCVAACARHGARAHRRRGSR